MTAFTPRSSNRSALPKAFAVLLFAYYAAVIVLHSVPPLLGDMGNWLYAGMLFARHLHGQSDTFHILKHYPVPNSTLTIALGLLCTILPWKLAFKVFLLVYLAICFVAVHSLSRASGASPLIWLIAPAGFFLSINFWYGFLAFQLGVAFLFFFVASLLNRTAISRQSDLVVGALLTLLFFTHMVPFTFACLLLLFFVLQTGRYRMLLQFLLPVALLCGYIAGRMREGRTEGAVAPTVSPHLLSAPFWAYKANTFLKSFGFTNPVDNTGLHSVALAHFGTPLFVALLLINLALCGALLALYVRGATLPRPIGHSAFLWLASFVALPVYLLCPRSLLGISDPGSRILQTVLWIALFLCMRHLTAHDTGSRVTQGIAAGAAVVLALAGAALFATIPWIMPGGASGAKPIQQATHLPTIVERLANAPNAYAIDYYGALQRNELDYQVFTTGIFLNRGALPTNPP